MCITVHYWPTVNVDFANGCFAVIVLWLFVVASGSSTIIVASVVIFVLRVHAGLEHGLEAGGSC